MKSDEAILVFLMFTIGLPLGLWFLRDDIYGFLQVVDLLWLKGLSFIPFIGDHYGTVANAYQSFRPEELTWRHIWIGGQIAWRPFVMLVILPMLLRWAWKAWKARHAQAFNDINKSYILKHCATKQTAPEAGARQQWVVRRWYQHYGLDKMVWGSADWNIRLRRALEMQLGKPSDHADSQALIKEFATFIYGQVVISFGEKQARTLPIDTIIEESTRSHAYCATAMVRVLAAARDTFGVVSPQGFRNRLFQSAETIPIWFALNGLNRQTTHIESQGVLSHFYVEVAEGEPLTIPQLDNAIKGLEKYRIHLIEQRKLKDLDQSAAYIDEVQRQQRKDALADGEAAALEPEKGYEEDSQRLI